WRLALGLDRLRHAEMRDLRVRIDLVDGIDRTAGDACLVEQLYPLRAGALDGIALHVGIERVTVLGPIGRGLIFRPLAQLGGVRRLQEARPDLCPGRGDVDVTVRGLEYAGRNAGGVIVARLLWHLAADEPARALEVEHEDLRLQQGSRDMLPLFRLLPLQQRHQNTERAKQAGAQIGDRDADAHRALPGQAGDRHQPAHALRNLVDARAVAIGSVLAEAGDAGEDDALVDLAQFVVVDAE